MKKSIFINAKTREIVSVNLNDQLQDTYNLIGCELVETGYYLEKNDVMVVDEEGLFKSGQGGFYFDDVYFYGSAMIWGCDNVGEAQDCKSDIDDISARIMWVDQEMSGVIRNSRLNSFPIVISA